MTEEAGRAGAGVRPVGRVGRRGTGGTVAVRGPPGGADERRVSDSLTCPEGHSSRVVSVDGVLVLNGRVRDRYRCAASDGSFHHFAGPVREMVGKVATDWPGPMTQLMDRVPAGPETHPSGPLPRYTGLSAEEDIERWTRVARDPQPLLAAGRGGSGLLWSAVAAGLLVLVSLVPFAAEHSLVWLLLGLLALLALAGWAVARSSQRAPRHRARPAQRSGATGRSPRE